jgi:hypothetical protein
MAGLENAQITGLSKDARRTEILRARNASEMQQELTDLLSTVTPTAWTAVTFQNSWANYGSGWQTAQYRKIGDIVYLRGLIAGGASATTAFTLPVGFRPPSSLLFAVDKETLTHGRLDVLSSGNVAPSWLAGSSAYFGLDGIQFSVT